MANNLKFNTEIEIFAENLKEKKTLKVLENPNKLIFDK